MYDECPICLDKLELNKIKLSCKHTFHNKCYNELIKKHSKCPICRNDISYVQENYTADIYFLIYTATSFLTIIDIFWNSNIIVDFTKNNIVCKNNLSISIFINQFGLSIPLTSLGLNIYSFYAYKTNIQNYYNVSIPISFITHFINFLTFIISTLLLDGCDIDSIFKNHYIYKKLENILLLSFFNMWLINIPFITFLGCNLIYRIYISG